MKKRSHRLKKDVFFGEPELPVGLDVRERENVRRSGLALHSE